eukprot:GDKH01002050.1.p3 GENE.GDKH01002050.1~~GDKH01002050.1.p3  ORF type:complete len:64 (+),score=7.16 GDKH01002050.1:1-192(+)
MGCARPRSHSALVEAAWVELVVWGREGGLGSEWWCYPGRVEYIAGMHRGVRVMTRRAGDCLCW